MMRQVFYHCAKDSYSGQKPHLVGTCHHIKEQPKESFTKITIFCAIITPAANGISWTGTLNLRMMRLVFYHCATDKNSSYWGQ